ncbi:conserved hypothetical protein [Ignisphaera aggregans DSM 17230]|uniref:NodB homology domain-containing protein n=1 Tax=Ignisphaera aggregans (strain DSM 17230 / JCM 13409 / AQ1.S1) TaxID=583356 RepID=E0SRE3_IGNAA|nr:conserved hypothetical protein [Ignisphaera aggregans DSM 17230]
MEKMLLVLTHDVDWSRRGPSELHVIQRFDRFSFEDKLRFFTLRENLYDGIRDIMEVEERYGIKSTFFFRPFYDDNTSIELYSDIISELVRRGWEIGLHANNTSSIESISQEKKEIERICGCRVRSMRAHYLRIDISTIGKLSAIGLELDSSICLSRDGLSIESSGCFLIDNVIELPITIMDTYMFTYWRISPDKVFEVLLTSLRKLYESSIRIATILWHTNSIRMIGGREYLRFIEDLLRYEWIEPIRVIDIRSLRYLCTNRNII